MRLASLALALGFLLTACPAAECPETTCGETECSEVCAAQTAGDDQGTAPADLKLSTFEAEMLAPVVEDVRAGVRPFAETSIGICKGKKECEEYLGMDVGELPPGNYIVTAELRVPDIGPPKTWKIDFVTECETTTKTDAISKNDHTRNYDVRYAGTERGYRLSPLRTVESPSKGGARSCKFKLVAPHPDGDKVYEGSWSTPAETEP